MNRIPVQVAPCLVAQGGMTDVHVGTALLVLLPGPNELQQEFNLSFYLLYTPPPHLKISPLFLINAAMLLTATGITLYPRAAGMLNRWVACVGRNAFQESKYPRCHICPLPSLNQVEG